MRVVFRGVNILVFVCGMKYVLIVKESFKYRVIDVNSEEVWVIEVDISSSSIYYKFFFMNLFF